MNGVTGRLAPSPTGLLHLGNAWAFLWAWLACRQAGGRLILRMEDIDPARSTAAFAAGIVEDLRWLGLDWDEGPVAQSGRFALYASALEKLKALGRVYPCYCTRRELRDLAGAPHVDDRGAPYPGTCRHLSAAARAEREAAGRRPCLRLNTEGLGPYTFTDAVLGPRKLSPEESGGDFALRRSDGVWAYQLAVVTDDALMGVTQVVRGEDILASTPRQLALSELLGYRPPSYAHIPLLCDAAGERLAKRHQSLSLRALRASGWDPRAIVGRLAALAGLIPAPRAAAPADLLGVFALEKLPRHPVVLETL